MCQVPAAPVFTALGEQSADFAVGDLDRDGLTDLVVTESAANAAVVYAGDGARRCHFLAFTRGGGEPGQVGVGDVDGDGDLDVATVNRTAQTMTNTLIYRSVVSPSLPARLDASFLSTGSQIAGGSCSKGHTVRQAPTGSADLNAAANPGE